MSNKVAFGVYSHFISAREARRVARLLKSLGYAVTITRCRNYIMNVVNYCEPMRPDLGRWLAREIAMELELQPRWPED